MKHTLQGPNSYQRNPMGTARLRCHKQNVLQALNILLLLHVSWTFHWHAVTSDMQSTLKSETHQDDVNELAAVEAYKAKNGT